MALTIDHGKQILPINSRELAVENDFSNSHIGNVKFVTDNSVHNHYHSSAEQRSIASGSSVEASTSLSELSWKSYPLCFVFEMMCRRIGDWRKFAINLEVDYLIRNLVEEEEFRETNKKIKKCIEEKIQMSKEQLNNDWFYWRNILLRIGEIDLVDDIEDKHPNLLKDDRIDLSDVDHQIIDDGFAIIAHYADRPENFNYLPVKFYDKIKICSGAGESKLYSLKKVEEMSNIYDDYFKKYSVLNEIRKYDFSNINESEECQILKIQHEWLKDNDDQGFTVKGYDANAHLQMFSDHVNNNPQTDSILTYSAKHNVIIHINKAKTNIKKSMKENCVKIRPLRTTHKFLKDQSYIFLPITLYDNHDKDEVYDEVKCKTCFDLHLIESSKMFEDLKLFAEWWENILPKIKYIRKKQDNKSDITDISKQFLKSIVGFIALANFYIPIFTNSPEEEIREVQKLIMFTPEQQDIIYSNSKRKIIKGSFGSGKTLTAQQLVKLVVRNVSDLDFVYYIIHDTNSTYIHEMKKLAEIFENQNVRACTIFDLTGGDKSLSAILLHLLRKHKGSRVHVCIEEFSGEILDEEEVEKVGNLLNSDVFKNSHIVLVCQSMESDRYLIQEGDRISYNRYQFRKLSERSGFQIFNLSYLLRSSKDINNIIDVAIQILDQTVTQSVVPSYNNNLASVDSSDDSNLSADDKESTTYEVASVIKLEQIAKNTEQANDKQDFAPNHSSDTALHLYDTDKLLKHFTVSLNQYESKMKLESSYTFVGKRESAQSVYGKKPVVYFLISQKNILLKAFKTFKRYFKEESENYSYGNQIYCLSKVLKKIEWTKVKDKQVIICLNEDSKNIVQVSLDVNKIKWTDDPQLLSNIEVHTLVTDYTSVRGCEFLNVIVVLTIDEQHLKHNLVDCLNRCILNLILIVLNIGIPDITLVKILHEWQKNDLVVVENENYLNNATQQELSKFNEYNKLMLIKDKQNKIVDFKDAEVIHKFFPNKFVFPVLPNDVATTSNDETISAQIFSKHARTRKYSNYYHGFFGQRY